MKPEIKVELREVYVCRGKEFNTSAAAEMYARIFEIEAILCELNPSHSELDSVDFFARRLVEEGYEIRKRNEAENILEQLTPDHKERPDAIEFIKRVAEHYNVQVENGMINISTKIED